MMDMTAEITASMHCLTRRGAGGVKRPVSIIVGAAVTDEMAYVSDYSAGLRDLVADTKMKLNFL